MRGAVADDFTGATDLAGNWRSKGLRTTVLLDVPDTDGPTVDPRMYDAVVVAQKIRSVEPAVARSAAKRAGTFLLDLGCTQIYDKYCSTFDSTPEGNVGPIADELTELTEASHAVVVPSFPDAGRTVYQGHLFVFDQLLNESPMRNHPLNPMLDSSIPRLLQPQTRYPVGKIGLDIVRKGPAELRKRIHDTSTNSHYIVVDAIDNSDLAAIAAATQQDRLVTGGSGLALGIPPERNIQSPVFRAPGHRLILSGSASAMTQRQVNAATSKMPARKADIDQILADPDTAVASTAEWVVGNWTSKPESPVIVYSVATTEDVAHARAKTKAASARFEEFFGDLALRLAQHDLSQLIVAGGETSGAVVEALQIRKLDLGEPLAPGVSWLLGSSKTGKVYNLVLKSGNFGKETLFIDAWDELNA